MKTVSVTITNEKAFALLEPLESLGLVKLDRTIRPAKNVSGKLYKSISTQKAKQLHRELEKRRIEWIRI